MQDNYEKTTSSKKVSIIHKTAFFAPYEFARPLELEFLDRNQEVPKRAQESKKKLDKFIYV